MGKKIDELERAKIFMPFDALQGLRQELSSQDVFIEKQVDLMDEQLDELNKIFFQIKKHDMIKITYYDGEKYQALEGQVKNIDAINQTILVENLLVSFEKILSIEKLK